MNDINDYGNATIDSLNQYVENKGGKLFIHDFNDENHQDNLWFGGVIASITYKGYEFTICANGDVRAWLLDESGEEITRVKDKGNNNNFWHVMHQYIESDEALNTLRECGRLMVEDSNWWELFCTDPDCTKSIVLDYACTLSEAITETADMFDELLDYFELPAKCEEYRQITHNEFHQLKEGDVVYIRCIGADPEYSKGRVIRPAFFNSDADEPGWELETSNGFCDEYSVYTKKEN